jgi:hypothetical protein
MTPNLGAAEKNSADSKFVGVRSHGRKNLRDLGATCPKRTNLSGRGTLYIRLHHKYFEKEESKWTRVICSSCLFHYYIYPWNGVPLLYLLLYLVKFCSYS